MDIGPTEAYGGIKRLFLAGPSRTFESRLEDEAQTLASIAKTADAEASRRFGKSADCAFRDDNNTDKNDNGRIICVDLTDDGSF